MKKLLALIMCVALLATTGVIFASAAPVTDNFTPAGDYEITWDPDAAENIKIDGDLSDWQDAGYSNDEITPDNLVSWAGTGTVDENFQINVYYVSDADFLYIAFYIVDDNFVPSTTQDGYDDGDAFQIAIDFNRELQKILESESAGLLQKNPKNIFYSFDCAVDDEFVFFRDEKKTNSREVLSESNGDGVKGAGSATADGWCAEFALSWEMLYEDFAYKSYFDDYSAILDKNNDLQLGITLCYLDRDASGTTISAAGTFKEAPTFTPENNGMSLTLKWAEGVTINCDGILTPAEGEEYVTGIEDEEGTDPTEETTAEETTAEETTAEETTAEETTAEETTAEAKTEAPKAEKKGCGSVVATGAAVAVLAAAAAAVALKKKD